MVGKKAASELGAEPGRADFTAHQSKRFGALVLGSQSEPVKRKESWW